MPDIFIKLHEPEYERQGKKKIRISKVHKVIVNAHYIVEYWPVELLPGSEGDIPVMGCQIKRRFGEQLEVIEKQQVLDRLLKTVEA